MPAGVFQLVSCGEQNVHFTGNPEFSHWKRAFRRHTNFALDQEELLPTTGNGEPLRSDREVEYRWKVPCDGFRDLLKSAYLLVDLPSVYSHYYEGNAAANAARSGYRFRWARALAARMVARAHVAIGGVKVHEVTGEWVQLWHRMFSPGGIDLDNYAALVGDLPEVHDPAAANGGVYPTSTLAPAQSVDPETLGAPGGEDTNPYLQPPSIEGRRLVVPLCFWFAQHPGMALPLAALASTEVTLTVVLRPTRDLYTVVDPRDTSARFGARVAPGEDYAAFGLHRFTLAASAATAQLSRGDDLRNRSGKDDLRWNVRMQIHYALLDDDERRKVERERREYTFEQVRHERFEHLAGAEELSLQSFRNMTTTLLWAARRSDSLQANQWERYVREEAEPAAAAFKVRGARANLRSAELLFNGVSRWKGDETDARIQLYEHRLRKKVPGVYAYAFALLPRDLQPSGACNLSCIKNVTLRAAFADVPYDPNPQAEPDPDDWELSDTLAGKPFDYQQFVPRYTYTVDVYALSYNVLAVEGGEGALLY